MRFSHFQLGGSVRSGVAADAGRDPDEGSVSFVLSGATAAARDPGESQGALSQGDHTGDGRARGVGLHHEGLWRRRGVLGGLRAPHQRDRERRQRIPIRVVGAILPRGRHDLPIRQRGPEGAISPRTGYV